MAAAVVVVGPGAPRIVVGGATPAISPYQRNGRPSPQHKPILAQRFRTKLCDKFTTTGSCPYVHRCMFAHGKDELRTAGQNVADGLVSEEAIRDFKREQYEARSSSVAGTAALMKPADRSSTLHGSNPPPPPPPPPPAMTPTVSPARRHCRYQHDPYAVDSPWVPAWCGRSQGTSSSASDAASASSSSSVYS